MLEGPGTTKGSALKGNLQIDAVRGVTRVRAWPRKRGPNVAPGTKAYNDWFRDCLNLIKRMEPGFLTFCYEKTKGTNIYPRDLAMQLLSGRGIMLLKPDGTKLFPEAYMEDVSLALDSLGQIPGTILVRGEQFWQGLAPPAAAELVLTSVGANEPPAWLPGGGGGGGASNWWWNPPGSAEFPLTPSGDATTMTATDDADVGLILDAGPMVVGNIQRLRTMNLTNPIGEAWRYQMRATWSWPAQLNGSFNMTIYEQATGKVAHIGWLSGGQIYNWRGTGLNAFTAGLGNFARYVTDYWVAIGYDPATDKYTFEYSADGKTWQTTSSTLRTTIFTTGADQIGFGCQMAQASSAHPKLAVQHWSRTI